MKCVDCLNFRDGFCDPLCLTPNKMDRVKIYEPKCEIECVLFERKAKDVDTQIKFDIDEVSHIEVSNLGIVQTDGRTVKIIIPKEIFVEAFDKFIGNSKSE